ncbi:Gfo/Idh/MocA family protein [Saccharopolyspora elongata]|uniref:Gfo/Idh/MocA family protein n=1 Tax=Saccharopolyspora elongata TaxID=2530387 RepID=UPI0014048361|nr:Gfo/Idh/MocA family oxidoreductase [Saccharopolyspora elongata]
MRFLVAGAGFGQQHLEWLGRCAADVRVLGYHSNRARAEELAARYGIGTVTTDVVGAIADGGVDAAVISSPPDTHEELAAAALDSGLAVITDKPLAHDVAAAARLAGHPSAQRAAVVFQWRINPALRELRRLLQAGEFGEVHHVELTFHHDFLAGPETAFPWRHRREHAGAGALADQGVHLFDVLRWIAPGDWQVTGARTAVACKERRGPTGPVRCETEDVADVWLADAGDRHARVFVSRIAAGRRCFQVIVQAARAVLVVEASPDDGSARLLVSTLGTAGPVVTAFPAHDMNPYPAILDRLSEVDGQHAGLIAGFDDALVAQQLLHQALAHDER